MSNPTNYILAESFHRANIQDRLWYVMAEADLDTLESEQEIKFGDKVYIITEKEFQIMGNDGEWYPM